MLSSDVPDTTHDVQRSPVISSFDEFIAPVSAEYFKRSLFGREFLHARGLPSRFEYLLTWNALNSILASYEPEKLELRIIKDGATLPKEKYTRPVHSTFFDQKFELDVKKTLALFRAGGALVINSFQNLHRPTQQLGDIVARALGSNVDFVVFAGWHGSQCFPNHWDLADTFIVQIIGSKHWRISRPQRNHPLLEDWRLQAEISPPKDAYWEGELKAGELLHIPRGWWHEVKALEGPTLHVTIAVKPPTGLDLVASILSDVEMLRANVPLNLSEMAKEDYLRRIRQELVMGMNVQSIDRFYSKFNASLPSRDNLGLPEDC